MQTIRGTNLTATVAYRVSLPIYQAAMDEALRRNVRLSEVMREITEAGIKAIKESEEKQHGS